MPNVNSNGEYILCRIIQNLTGRVFVEYLIFKIYLRSIPLCITLKRKTQK